MRLGFSKARAASGPFNGHATLASDLVSYWAMGEASGVREDSLGINDLVDNNTVGTAAAPLFPAGVAASFNGTNQEWFSLADSATTVWGEGGSFTIAMWYKVRGASSGFGAIFTRSGAGVRPWDVFTDTGSAAQSTLVLCDAGDAIFHSTPAGMKTLLQDGNFHHMIMSFTAADKKVRVSVDGGAETFTQGTAHANAALDASDQNVFFGGGWTHGHSNTDMAHVGIWDGRVLTAQEQSDLWNGGAGRFY